jgi:high-affinity nickel-transport protein
MRVAFTYRSPWPVNLPADAQIEYADTNFPGRAGWKELVCDAANLKVASSGCGPERSNELNNYVTDLLNSPPQDTSASLTLRIPAAWIARAAKNSTHSTHFTAALVIAAVAPGDGGAGKPQPTVSPVAAPKTPRSAFTELIHSNNNGFWFLLVAALIAASLGALHALEPGHGKTIVAAYLVGSNGTAAQAIALGLIVTTAHTAGVYLLGAITLYASRYLFPEQIYPWLGLLSGSTIAGLGIFLVLQRWSNQDFSHAEGDPAAAHSHWFSKAPSLRPASANDSKTVSLKQLLLLGVTGGMIPCPAALVVLLSAISLHRIGFGFFLIVAFSVGLAAVLIGIGLLMVYARRFMARWQSESRVFRRWLPLTSAVFITLLGLGIAVRAFAGTAIAASFHIASPGAFLVTVALGLFLGMRHSIDPDHVVAVSTIVSRQRSVRHGAKIGAMWGLGHTLTIFVVGSAIILFGIAVPPRLGLSMELMVAFMLILLGALNLTGLLPQIRARFSRQHPAAEVSWRTTKPALGNGLVRPLAVGIVHGLAGSAAVALLVLSTIRTPGWAICYLLVFGLGTVSGMMLMTAAIATPFAYSGRHFSRMSGYLGVGSGLVSLTFGSFLVYQIGFLNGLFTSNPHWIPR